MKIKQIRLSIIKNSNYYLTLFYENDIITIENKIFIFYKKEVKLVETIRQAKNLRREYLKEWRAKNKDKVKEYNQRYWLKKAAELQEKQKESEANG